MPGYLRAPLAHGLASWGGVRDPARTRLEATWGGSVELPGATGRRPEPGCGPVPQPDSGRQFPGDWCWGPPGEAGVPSGALRGRRPAGDPTRQPTVNVALGIPRGPWQGPGLAGSLAGRPAWGSLGLGLYRPPCFARTSRGPRQALWLRSAGPQSQKGADALGPPTPSTLVVTAPAVLVPRHVRILVPCVRSRFAVGADLGRAGWPSGIMSNGVLGSRGGTVLLGLGGGRTRRPGHTGVQDELVAREPGPRLERERERDRERDT